MQDFWYLYSGRHSLYINWKYISTQKNLLKLQKYSLCKMAYVLERYILKTQRFTCQYIINRTSTINLYIFYSCIFSKIYMFTNKIVPTETQPNINSAENDFLASFTLIFTLTTPCLHLKHDGVARVNSGPLGKPEKLSSVDMFVEKNVVRVPCFTANES